MKVMNLSGKKITRKLFWQHLDWQQGHVADRVHLSRVERGVVGGHPAAGGVADGIRHPVRRRLSLNDSRVS